MTALSTTLNSELMANARKHLAGKWAPAIGMIFMYIMIVLILSVIPVVKNFASLLVTGPFSLGMAIFFLAVVEDQEPEVLMLFEGFNQFVKALATYLLMVLFILLWLLLLIVPGLMAAYSYSMVFYILRDNPELGPREAIERSKQMMYGNRWKYFCLHCRFIGWALLCLLTLGLGFLVLAPYMAASNAEFYKDLLRAEQAGGADQAGGDTQLLVS